MLVQLIYYFTSDIATTRSLYRKKNMLTYFTKCIVRDLFKLEATSTPMVQVHPAAEDWKTSCTYILQQCYRTKRVHFFSIQTLDICMFALCGGSLTQQNSSCTCKVGNISMSSDISNCFRALVGFFRLGGHYLYRIWKFSKK